MEQLWAFVLAAYIAVSLILWAVVIYMLFPKDDFEEWKSLGVLQKAFAVTAWTVAWPFFCIYIAIRGINRRNKQ